MTFNNPLLTLLDTWSRRYVWRRLAPQAPQTTPAVIVTGASEGIGLDLARRFARGGSPAVVLVARRLPELQSAAADIAREFGVQAIALAIDVNDVDAGPQIERELAARKLHTEVFINNAGFGLSGDFADQSPADLDALVSCNIAALTRLSRHFLPGMLARRQGGLINVASLAGLTPGPYQAAYYASKAYVLSLTRAIAYETAGSGIRVCVVTPGPVETAFHARAKAETAFYRLMPAPTAETIADAIYSGFRWHRRVIAPGIMGLALSLVMRIVPSFFVIPVTAWLLYPRGTAAGGTNSEPKKRPASQS